MQIRENQEAIKSEVDIYLTPNTTVEIIVDEAAACKNGQGGLLTALQWWKKHASTFPRLAHMARHFLGIPATSVASECAFSTAGRLITDYRNSLSGPHVRILMLCRSWLRAERKFNWTLCHDFKFCTTKSDKDLDKDIADVLGFNDNMMP